MLLSTFFSAQPKAPLVWGLVSSLVAWEDLEEGESRRTNKGNFKASASSPVCLEDFLCCRFSFRTIFPIFSKKAFLPSPLELVSFLFELPECISVTAPLTLFELSGYMPAFACEPYDPLFYLTLNVAQLF